MPPGRGSSLPDARLNGRAERIRRAERIQRRVDLGGALGKFPSPDGKQFAAAARGRGHNQPDERRNAMIDHLVLNVRELGASRRFFEQVLSPLGYGVAMSFPDWVGLG